MIRWLSLSMLLLAAPISAKSIKVDGTVSGSLSAMSITATIQPDGSDLGKSGALFVGAVSKGQYFMLTDKGWQAWSGGSIPAYSSVTFGTSHSVNVTASQDLSSLGCTEIYIGYGSDSADMLANLTLGLAAKVPANPKTRVANDCSSSTTADIVRFLNQATWGPTDAAIAKVQAMGGIAAYLEDQLNTPASSLGSYAVVPTSAPSDCTGTCYRDGYTPFQMQLKFFQNAMTGNDQLRQRVGFALSQIMVVSAQNNNIQAPYGFAAYQQMLIDNAFGNIRDILMNVTLSPVMGRYLDMVNNDKPDAARSTSPNENYARELLQLFSVGLWKLNSDGTLQYDSSGNPIPAYGETDVLEFARVFTGWTYPTQAGKSLVIHNPVYFQGNMELFASNHDTGAKTLLDGYALSANQTGSQDLNLAIDNIYNHSNLGPFISKQLIQFLVTGNPSPAYVSRVTAVFNNNGTGVRGDLKSVVRAILLDSEARGDVKTATDYGRLREPVQFIVNTLRALNGTSDGVYLRSSSSNLGQSLYNPTTVFNYYPPDYLLPGTEVLAPAFAILDSSTVLARSNFVYQMVFGNGANADSTVSGSIGSKIDLSPYTALASDPESMVTKLDQLLMHGTMTATMRSTIVNTVSAISATSTTTRAQTAVYLVLTSPQYQVMR